MKFSLLLTSLILPLSAQLRITEVMPNSNHSDPDAGGDWFEITNTGTAAVNIANYSFDDDSAQAGTSGPFPSYSLTAGESLIVLRDASSTAFRALWNLPATLRIITESELTAYPGFGSNGDAVNLYNNGGGLIDTLAYGAATEGFSFARFVNGAAIPGAISSDGLFDAYESDDPSEDVGSPGIAAELPSPLPPLFTGAFSTAGLENSNLAVSVFRITAIDPNPGDTITITAAGTPAWLSVTDLGGGLASLGGTPPSSAIGAHEFEITATDNNNMSSSQTYRIDVLPSNSTIILNEYNAVASDEFLDGGAADDVDGAADPFFGRIAGNGGAWVEFVVTQTMDLRNWTLEITSDDTSRTLKLSDHVALSVIPAGTILTFTESNQLTPTGFNINSLLNSSGYTWTNIWMHDSTLIDQSNSTHPSSPAINSSNTVFTWINSLDEIVYGPSGESVALQDSDDNGIGDTIISVGGSETFRLETNPTTNINPLNLNYDDGGSSTFGAPNTWSDNTMTQSFAAFFDTTTPPSFSSVNPTKAIRGEYLSIVDYDGSPFTVIEAPDFLDLVIQGAVIVISNNRPLTSADTGKYEVSLSADNNGAIGYLVYELEVLNPTPALILNEYNAVASDRFLNGGTLTADEDGGPASADSHFARVAGNGGNWFELVLVGDGTAGFTDLTNWSIEVGQIANSGVFVPSSTITLSDSATWSAVAHGTLLTFIDQNTAGGGLNTEINRVDELTSTGLAWTNIHVGTAGTVTGTGLSELAIGSSNTAFLIKDASGNNIFGPAGEGIAPLDGVGSEEIFELENDPLLSVSSCDTSSASTLGYDDGSSSSTFGSPNLFAPIGSATDRAQDFSAFVLSPLQAYLASIGLPGADPNADEDNDGFSNLDEYLFGGDPVDLTVFPQTTLDPSTGTISTTVRVSDPNFTLTPERSPDLINWFTDELQIVDEASPLGADFLIRNMIYDGTASRMFFRVKSQ